MEQKFWKPAVTSQFTICPIPFHLDTYRGCKYNCSYCFARDLCTFSRRNSEHKSFSYLVGNRPDRIEAWIKRTAEKDYDYNKPEEVAFKERIPLKIGATADPCPPEEMDENITLLTLTHLAIADNYPVKILTKNPKVLYHILKKMPKIPDENGKLQRANISACFTLMSTDKDFVKHCEPNAPSPKERLRYVKKITDMGFPVMAEIHPAIVPKIHEDMPELVKAFKEAGCWAFNVEGLKVRIAMPKAEQKIIQRIGDYLKFDIRAFYKSMGNRTGSDWEIGRSQKQQYHDLAIKLAKEYKLKCFVSDNDPCKGCKSSECCGTEVLTNYKIWGGNVRTKYYKDGIHSEELGKCKVNFTRSKKYEGKTIDEAMKDVKEWM